MSYHRSVTVANAAKVAARMADIDHIHDGSLNTLVVITNIV